jgi:hypothetical protein
LRTCPRRTRGRSLVVRNLGPAVQDEEGGGKCE